VAKLAAIVIIIVSMRFGMRGLLIGLPLAALVWWAYRPRLPPGTASDAGAVGGRAPAQMTQAEALRILGLEPGASRDAIKAAHRELIKKVHPDQGGSGYLAQQVNEAKQVLLQR
jgi:hypothetical protein